MKNNPNFFLSSSERYLKKDHNSKMYFQNKLNLMKHSMQKEEKKDKGKFLSNIICKKKILNESLYEINEYPEMDIDSEAINIKKMNSIKHKEKKK